MKVLIRKIRHSDYLGIIDLFNECFNKNIMYHDLNFTDNKIIIVAEVNNEIVASAEIDILNNEIENRKYSIVNNICIKKEYQKSSIVTLLIEACVNLSKENECLEVMLAVNSKYNFDLCKKLGFKDIDNLIFKKDINSKV